MANQSDFTLAQLSLAAYSETPTILPAGFTPVATEALGLDPAAGSYVGGIFRNGSAAALVTSGTVDGTPTLVVAFRGSDDREDSVADLRDINATYAEFRGLVAAVDAYAAEAGFGQVAVTGHSLGGAMAQIYMAEHPGDATREANTFGSPGVLQAAGADARIENFVIADDPAVVLGANRAVAGAILQADPALAEAVALRAAGRLPGLTAEDALASIPFLTANYVNRGSFEVLPAASGGTDAEAVLSGLARAGAARHAPTLYVVEVAKALTMGGTVVVADEGGEPADLFYHAFYSGEVQDLSPFEPLLPGFLRDQAMGLELSSSLLDDLPVALGQEWHALRASADATLTTIADGLI